MQCGLHFFLVGFVAACVDSIGCQKERAGKTFAVVGQVPARIAERELGTGATERADEILHTSLHHLTTARERFAQLFPFAIEQNRVLGGMSRKASVVESEDKGLSAPRMTAGEHVGDMQFAGSGSATENPFAFGERFELGRHLRFGRLAQLGKPPRHGANIGEQAIAGVVVDFSAAVGQFAEKRRRTRQQIDARLDLRKLQQALDQLPQCCEVFPFALAALLAPLLVFLALFLLGGSDLGGGDFLIQGRDLPVDFPEIPIGRVTDRQRAECGDRSAMGCGIAFDLQQSFMEHPHQ